MHKEQVFVVWEEDPFPDWLPATRQHGICDGKLLFGLSHWLQLKKRKNDSVAHLEITN